MHVLRALARSLLAALLCLVSSSVVAEATKITFLHVNDINEIEPRPAAPADSPRS